MWNQLQNRQLNDLYATRPHDVKLLYKYEPSIIEGKIWECACGHGHIVKTLQELGATDVYGSDIIDYGFGYDIYDFLSGDDTHTDEFDTIFTNPPYKFTTEFIITALNKIKDGGRVIMLMPTTVLAGVNRYVKIFNHTPPKYVYVFSRNTYGILVGEGEGKYQSPNLSHSWFIFEKGYSGDTIVRWLYEDKDPDTITTQKSNKTNIRVRREISTSESTSEIQSKCPGVRLRGSTWEVRIKVNGKYIHIGRFASEDDAIAARKQAEIKYRGGNNNE